MNKLEFLSRLRAGLAGLPQEDIDERTSFYSEMIDDHIEDGLSEEEAVAKIGSAENVAAQIIADTPLTKLVKEKVKPKRKLKTWEIVLLAVGSPLWVSLLIAAAAVVLSLYISLWACVISLWVVNLVLAVSFLGCAVAGVAVTVQGYWINGLLLFGAALLCAGLAVFLFFGCLAATKGAARLAKVIVLGIKSLFVKKEAAQ